MPSHLHEMIIEMFRERPALAADLLGGPLGVRLPAYDRARLASGELTDVVATEYRADVVVTFSTRDTEVLAVVTEVQLRIDARKRRTWPAYVATLHARLGCPVMLLVLCPDPRVAAWCAAPIVVGEPGLVLRPVVLGPGDIPVITDPALARLHPEQAVLSALAHGGSLDPQPVFTALLAALDVVDHDHANLYADVVLTVLPTAAREYLEALMTATNYEFQSDFARRYFDRGRATGEATGEARAVLAILDARGIEVPADVRNRITGCTDVELLDAWVRRAVSAEKADDLFTA